MMKANEYQTTKRKNNTMRTRDPWATIILLIRETVLSDKPNMIFQHVGYSYSKSNELVYSVFLILKKTLFVNKAKFG